MCAEPVDNGGVRSLLVTNASGSNNIVQSQLFLSLGEGRVASAILENMFQQTNVTIHATTCELCKRGGRSGNMIGHGLQFLRVASAGSPNV